VCQERFSPFQFLDGFFNLKETKLNFQSRNFFFFLHFKLGVLFICISSKLSFSLTKKPNQNFKASHTRQNNNYNDGKFDLFYRGQLHSLSHIFTPPRNDETRMRV